MTDKAISRWVLRPRNVSLGSCQVVEGTRVVLNVAFDDGEYKICAVETLQSLARLRGRSFDCNDESLELSIALSHLERLRSGCHRVQLDKFCLRSL